jgi:hypothetical protein
MRLGKFDMLVCALMHALLCAAEVGTSGPFLAFFRAGLEVFALEQFSSKMPLLVSLESLRSGFPGKSNKSKVARPDAASDYD